MSQVTAVFGAVPPWRCLNDDRSTRHAARTGHLQPAAFNARISPQFHAASLSSRHELPTTQQHPSLAPHHQTTAVAAAPAIAVLLVGSGGGGSSRSNNASSIPPVGANDYKQIIRDALQGDASSSFVELVFKGRLSSDLPWRQATLRPVFIKGRRYMQVSCFWERQNIVKNLTGEALQEKLEELLSLPFNSIQLRTFEQDMNVQLTRKGKPIIHRLAPTRQQLIGNLEHDRRKELPISRDPHPFLQKIGFQTSDGRIRADMVDKFAQVNEFLKLLAHTGAVNQLVSHRGSGQATTTNSSASSATAQDNRAESLKAATTSSSQLQQPIRILDCGCGSSHLTFGTFHYLSNVRGLPTCITGVDTNAMLMQRSNAYSQELGLGPATAQFFTSSILDFQPDAQPDIVLALHACDTATDEAIALGIKQGAPIIMAVPCCHKNLQGQLASAASSPPLFAPMLRHGIMKQRFVDMLTDTFRACMLRICGYKTDIVEFVSTEHTPRNLLIRAVKAHAPGTPSTASTASTDHSAVEGNNSMLLSSEGFSSPTMSARSRDQQTEARDDVSVHEGPPPPAASDHASAADAPSSTRGHGVPSQGTSEARHTCDRHRSPAVAAPWQCQSWQEYEALKQYWQVTPYLEQLLQEELEAVASSLKR